MNAMDHRCPKCMVNRYKLFTTEQKLFILQCAECGWESSKFSMKTPDVSDHTDSFTLYYKSEKETIWRLWLTCHDKDLPYKSIPQVADHITELYGNEEQWFAKIVIYRDGVHSKDEDNIIEIPFPYTVTAIEANNANILWDQVQPGTPRCSHQVGNNRCILPQGHHNGVHQI